MKHFKILLTALFVAVALTACSDDEPENVNMSGTWYFGYVAATDNYDYTILDLGKDGNFTFNRCMRTPADASERHVNTLGTWSVSGKGIILSYPGAGTDVYTLVDYVANTSATLTLRGEQVVWYRSKTSLPRQ